MGVLEKGLSFFVEMDDSTQKPNNQAISKNTPIKVPLPIDNEMADRLNKVVLNRKTAYTALLETAEKLKRSIPDDATRLRASFDLIAADGRTIDSISQAIDVHVADLDGEHLRFKSSTDSRLQQQSKLPRDQANVLTKQNSDLSNEIDALRTKITQFESTIQQNNSQITDLNNEADRLEADIKSVYEKFKNAVEQIKTELLNKKSILITTLGR